MPGAELHMGALRTSALGPMPDAASPKLGWLAARKKRLAPAGALVIWLVWVVLPAVWLETPRTTLQALVAAQVGRSAPPYLGSAPLALCHYLVLSQGAALAALLALVWGLVDEPGRGGSLAEGIRKTAPGFLRLLGAWILLYLVGNALMAVVDLAHGEEAAVVLGFGARLGLYGLLVTLPQLSWVLACRAVTRRFWLVIVLAVVGAALLAIFSIALEIRQTAWPTLAFLRNELFSGMAERVTSGALGLSLWAGALLALAVVVRLTPFARRQPSRTAPVADPS